MNTIINEKLLFSYHNYLNVTRPIESIIAVIDSVLKCGMVTPIQVSLGDTLHLNLDEICIIEDTEVTMSLRFQSDGLLSVVGSSPTIFLGGKLFSRENNSLFVEFHSNTIIYFSKIEEFTKLADEMSLWKKIADILNYQQLQVMLYQRRAIGHNSYNVVRALIFEYCQLPEAFRQQFLIGRYIIERSLISRSNVMKILSMLKNRGHIILNRGVLVFVNDLPLTLW